MLPVSRAPDNDSPGASPAGSVACGALHEAATASMAREVRTRPEDRSDNRDMGLLVMRGEHRNRRSWCNGETSASVQRVTGGPRRAKASPARRQFRGGCRHSLRGFASRSRFQHPFFHRCRYVDSASSSQGACSVRPFFRCCARHAAPGAVVAHTPSSGIVGVVWLYRGSDGHGGGGVRR